MHNHYEIQNLFNKIIKCLLSVYKSITNENLSCYCFQIKSLRVTKLNWSLITYVMNERCNET